MSLSTLIKVLVWIESLSDQLLESLNVAGALSQMYEKCIFISAIYIFWFPYQYHTCQIWKSKHSLVYKFKNFFYENNTEGNKSKAYITLISHFVQSNINLIKLGLTCYSNLTKECSSCYDVLHVYVYQTSLGTNSRMKIDLFNLKYW